MQERIEEYISWIAINILLPISPVFIKLAINIFADNKKISIVVLDSVELLYYNLFICVIFLNLSVGHEHINFIELIMKYIFVLICILDLILIFLNYAEIESYKCSVAAIVLSIFVPIVVSIYQWINMENQGGISS